MKEVYRPLYLKDPAIRRLSHIGASVHQSFGFVSLRFFFFFSSVILSAPPFCVSSVSHSHEVASSMSNPHCLHTTWMREREHIQRCPVLWLIPRGG